MTVIGILLIIFAIFIIPILVILAFIAPKLLNIKTDKRPEGKHNRKEFLTGLCGLFIISVIAGAMMMPSEDKAKTAKDTPAPVAPKPTSADPAPISTATPQAVASVPSAPKVTEQVKTLGITPEEFRAKYNSMITKHEFKNLAVNEPFELHENEKGSTFDTIVADKVHFMGVIAKNGQLKELIVIYEGSDEKVDFMNYMLTAVGTYGVIVGNDTDVRAFTNLIRQALKGINKENNSHSMIVNHVKVYTLAGKPIGLWAGFTPA